MSTPFALLLESLKRFAGRYLNLVCAYHLYEALKSVKAPNIVGVEVADKNVASQNEFRHFFLTTDEALRIYILLELAKFFDTKPRTLSVRWVIKTVKNNLSQLGLDAFIAEHAGREILPELFKDYKPLDVKEAAEIERLVAEHAELLSRLVTYRNNSLAHDAIEPKKVIITHGEIGVLMKLLERVINKLALHLDFSSYAWSHLEKECSGDVHNIQDLLNGIRATPAPTSI